MPTDRVRGRRVIGGVQADEGRCGVGDGVGRAAGTPGQLGTRRSARVNDRTDQASLLLAHDRDRRSRSAAASCRFSYCSTERPRAFRLPARGHRSRCCRSGSRSSSRAPRRTSVRLPRCSRRRQVPRAVRAGAGVGITRLDQWRPPRRWALFAIRLAYRSSQRHVTCDNRHFLGSVALRAVKTS